MGVLMVVDTLTQARALQAAGDLHGAEQLLRRALRSDADNAEAHNHLGVVLAQQGQWDLAVGSFEQACRLRPTSAEMADNLRGALAAKSNREGTLLPAKGHPPAAPACYRRAVEHKPEFAEAHNNLGLALAEQHHAAAAVS